MAIIARFQIVVPKGSADLVKLVLTSASGLATEYADSYPLRIQDPDTYRYRWQEVAQAIISAIDSVSIEEQNDKEIGI